MVTVVARWFQLVTVGQKQQGRFDKLIHRQSMFKAKQYVTKMASSRIFDCRTEGTNSKRWWGVVASR